MRRAPTATPTGTLAAASSTVRPLRRAEVWVRWLVDAAEHGLPVGVESDLVLGDPDDGPVDASADQWWPDDVDAALDRLVGLARQPRWRLDRQAHAIVADPAGTTDLRGLLGDLFDDLERSVGAEHRAGAVAELHARPLPAERVARRWGVSQRTLYRWRDELARVANLPGNGTADPSTAADDGGVQAWTTAASAGAAGLDDRQAHVTRGTSR